MATLAQIKSPVWSYSLSGGIVEGIAAIRQSIEIILRTTKGSDPLRPLFGSDVCKYQDYPVNVAIPNIKKEILLSLSIWEQRITVTNVTHAITNSRLYLYITYRLIESNLTDELIFQPSEEPTIVKPQSLTLQAIVPNNPYNYQFWLSCILDEVPLLPQPPETGFATPEDLHRWIVANWSNYGTWYLTNDSVIGRIRPGYQTGSITINLLEKRKYTASIPNLSAGYKYAVSLDVNSKSYYSENNIHTIEEIISWLQLTVPGIGEWFTENMPGSFDFSFNDDFLVYITALSIITDALNIINISIDTIQE